MWPTRRRTRGMKLKKSFGVQTFRGCLTSRSSSKKHVEVPGWSAHRSNVPPGCRSLCAHVCSTCVPLLWCGFHFHEEGFFPPCWLEDGNSCGRYSSSSLRSAIQQRWPTERLSRFQERAFRDACICPKRNTTFGSLCLYVKARNT